jgi:hypothetical protein
MKLNLGLGLAIHAIRRVGGFFRPLLLLILEMEKRQSFGLHLGFVEFARVT